MRYVWWAPAAHAAIDALSPSEFEQYEKIQVFIAVFPYPEENPSVRRHRMFGIDGYRYFDNEFPYWIFYEVRDEEVLVRLLWKAATSRTPL